MKSTILASALLTTFTTATPLKRQAPNYPASSNSVNFKLIANVTAGNFALGIENWAVNSYHTGAGTAYAVLTNPSSSPGRLFYANGTYKGHGDYKGVENILSDEGSSPMFPAGFVVPTPANATALVSVEINGGLGTDGVGIAGFPAPVAELGYHGGSWRVCNETLLYGPAMQLFWQGGYETPIPEGCAQVRLFPQCKFDIDVCWTLSLTDVI